MKTPTKKPRQYHKITPNQLARFKAAELLLGNGSAAVRQLTPTILNPKERAFRIRIKSNQEASADYIDDSLQQIGVDAVNRVGMMVNSTDEKVATKNSHYVIDHIRGQAVRRSESKHLNLTIETVLD